MNTTVFDGKTAIEHAETAAQAIRAINHLTSNTDALPYPPAAAQLVGHLSTLAARLPQTLEQVTGQVQRWQQAGQLGIDDRAPYGDPAILAAVIDLDLTEADAAAAELGAALNRAHQALAHACYVDAEDDRQADEATGAAGASS
jgi:hypothetical protein